MSSVKANGYVEEILDIMGLKPFKDFRLKDADGNHIKGIFFFMPNFNLICNDGLEECQKGIITKHIINGKYKILRNHNINSVVLSSEQKEVLKKIDKEYKWIAKDDNSIVDNMGSLFVYENKPEMDCGEYRLINGTCESFNMFSSLFMNIKNGECYNIKELLKENGIV